MCARGRYEIVEGFEDEAARRLEDLCFAAKSQVFASESVTEFATRSQAHQELLEEAVEGYVMSGVHSKVCCAERVCGFEVGL